MIDIGTDELYELASIAKSDPYGHPYEQVLDNFDNFRCLMTPSLIMWLIDSLREAERDAARYRWIKENSQLGVGRCGIDWELHFEGPAPDNSAMIERHIDEAMQCK